MSHEGPSTAQTKHLELIQGVINRQTGNASALKGWSVAVMGGLTGLMSSGGSGKLIAFALVPGVAFLILDAYYLRQERLFRALYDAVRLGDPTIPPFSMDTTPVRSNTELKTTWTCGRPLASTCRSSPQSRSCGRTSRSALRRAAEADPELTPGGQGRFRSSKMRCMTTG